MRENCSFISILILLLIAGVLGCSKTSSVNGDTDSTEDEVDNSDTGTGDDNDVNNDDDDDDNNDDDDDDNNDDNDNNDNDNDTEECDDCLSLENGDTAISGDPRVDGLFVATLGLVENADATKQRLAQSVETIANAFEISTEGLAIEELVAGIKAGVAAEVGASLSYGPTPIAFEPLCSANVAVAFDAQYWCESTLGCDGELCDAETEGFNCQGKCMGDADGECEIKACFIDSEDEQQCAESCVGACKIQALGEVCEGKCEGECAGECSELNGSAECAGFCDGACSGTCTVSTLENDSCEAGCLGMCVGNNLDQENCPETIGCFDHFDGTCKGACLSSVNPPSCGVAACVFTEDCQVQSAAQGAADITCTEPTIELVYQIHSALDEDAGLRVQTKLKILAEELTKIWQDHLALKAMIEGDAEEGIEPSVLLLASATQATLSNLESLSIAPCFFPCAVVASAEANAILGNLPGEQIQTLMAQAELLSLIF